MRRKSCSFPSRRFLATHYPSSNDVLVCLFVIFNIKNSVTFDVPADTSATIRTTINDLTEDGAVFKGYVDEALGVLDDGVAAIRIRQGALSGTVQVGAIATVRADYLPALVLDYRRKRGNLIELRIEQGSTQELVEALLAGKIDLALAAKPDDPRISFTRLFDHSVGVIVSQDHPLAQCKNISLTELAQHQVYTYRADLPMGIRLDAFLRANGVEPTAMNLNRDSDDEVMLGGIVSREPVVGLCLLTSSMLTYRNLKIVPLREPAARDIYSIGILRVAGSRLGPVAKDFLAHIDRDPCSICGIGGDLDD